MSRIDRQTKVAVILNDHRGEQALRRVLPQLFEAPEIPEGVPDMMLGVLFHYGQLSDADTASFFEALADLVVEDRVEAPAIDPDPQYESGEIARASARLTTAAEGVQYRTHELFIDGPSHGNPFVDVELWADFRSDDAELRVGGFYDGDGRYALRFLPPAPGRWHYTTGSTARSLDGISGAITVAPSGQRGPVRASEYHFRYANGDAYRPIGTTLYAWTHQDTLREEQTLATLASASFTKVRMCVFPKHYDFTRDEPPRLPFEKAADGTWDTTRFDVGFFRHLEERIGDLAALGIEADVILFHPYDRWGFQDLGVAADDRYVRYLVRRLAGFPNVWWSLANEYDAMASKRHDDWVRIGRLVAANDHANHLLSIHNWIRIFDFGAEWITHCSIQKTDSASPVPHIEQWRSTWRKPVVLDEIGYEGDIEFEWGSLSPEELVHRFWQSAVRGAYVTHGETYRNPESKLWWATGGKLVGSSPERIAFLARLLAESPTGRWEPLAGYSHVKAAGEPGRYEVHYFDHYQPGEFRFSWPEGRRAIVDFIDPWAMTIENLAGRFEDEFTLALPGRPHLAVRLRSDDAS